MQSTTPGTTSRAPDREAPPCCAYDWSPMRLVALIERQQLPLSTEKHMQAELERVLRGQGIPFDRERALTRSAPRLGTMNQLMVGSG